MTEKNYEAVHSASLSREMEDDRYIVIDIESGEILDTANGWGYPSKDNAYRAFEYKLRHGEKDMRPAPTNEEIARKEYEAGTMKRAYERLFEKHSYNRIPQCIGDASTMG